jgi:protocatechuate 3,4-dioxygenase, alpha subunit
VKDEGARVATPSQTVGPFFHVGLTPQPSIGMAAPHAGERIRLRVTVTDGDGQPVDDALVEVWHGDVFGRMPTDKHGACEFDTVRPAAHINVCLFARGLLRQLHSRIYFEGDPGVAADSVLALVPEDRRATLLAHPDPQDSRRWLFHVRLQGAQETVFFDP